MRVQILKTLSTSAGDLFPGTVVDATGWANLAPLLDQGYITPAPMAGVEVAPDAVTETRAARRGREVPHGSD